MIFSVSDNIDQVRRQLSEIEQKQIPFAASRALNDAAEAVRQGLRSEMSQKLDRPTPYALNALQITPSNKAKLFAFVGFKEFGGTPAYKFLRPQVEGGGRNEKRSERALQAAGLMESNERWVPGRGMRLDRFGNVPGSAITRILSQLKAQRDPLQNTTARSAKRNKARAGVFVPSPGSRLKRGVYERTGRTLKPLLIFIKRPTYRPRLNWYPLANTIALKAFAAHFADRLKEALATAR